MQRIAKPVMTFVLMIFLLMFAFPAFADGTTLDVHTSTAADGTVTAEVVLDGTLIVSGIQFALNYDDSRLQLSKYEDGDLKSSTVNDTESGKVALVWYSVNGVSVSGESSVLRLTFIPKADGETNISFDSGALNTMVVDHNLATVTTQANGATINIKSTDAATSTAVTASSAPVVTAELVVPVPTPSEVTPTPPAPQKITTATPTPSPSYTSAEPSKTPTSSNAAALSQTPSVTQPPINQTPLAAENYNAPQLAELQPANVPVTPTAKPEIEVITNPDSTPPTAWLWIALGIVLLSGTGFLTWQYFYNKRHPKS